MRILLAEDDRDTAAFIENGLRELGHAVVPAATGEDGVRSLAVALAASTG